MKRYVNCNYFINLMFSEDVPYQFASLRAYKMPFPRVILSQVLSPSCCKRSSSSSNALVKVAFCWSTVGWRVSSCHASSWFQLPVKACKRHQGKKYQVRKKGYDFRRPLKCSTWIQRRQKGDSISIQSPSPCISKRMLKQFHVENLKTVVGLLMCLSTNVSAVLNHPNMGAGSKM